MKYFIIGSGASGLATAYTLCKQLSSSDDENHVILCEKGSHFGGHAYTVNVNGEMVDIGFMVMNTKTYPNLLSIFRDIGANVDISDMSFASIDPKESKVWSSVRFTLNNIFKYIWKWSTWTWVWNYYCFTSLAHKHVYEEDNKQKKSFQSFEELLENSSISDDFQKNWLVPLISAVWSTPSSATLTLPAYPILKFMINHQFLGWRQIQWLTPSNRSQDYVSKILKYCENAENVHFEKHLSTSATNINSKKKRIILFDSNTGKTREVSYDALILTCSAPDQCKLNPPERPWLEKFSTYTSKIVLHNKPYGMPYDESDWCSWNATVPNDGEKKKHGAQVTYWLSNLQGLKDRSVFLSLNPSCDNIPGKLQTVELKHPCMDKSAINGQAEERNHQGTHGVFHAGAWLRWGFHEDGMVTGIIAAKRALEYCGNTSHNTVPLRYVINHPGEFSEFSIVQGVVTHERIKPIRNKFTYRIESCRFNLRHPPAGFSRQDHFGDPSLSMDTCVRELLAKKFRHYFTGDIEAVCNLRWGPFCFNPITVYFVYSGPFDSLRVDKTGDLCAMVCEVHNTPWLERTTYAMLCDNHDGELVLRPSIHLKKMHVSPFNPCPDTAESYFEFVLKTSTTTKHTVLHVNLLDQEKNPKINVQWKMNQGRKTRKRSIGLLISSIMVLFGIYWNAFKLFWKIPSYTKKQNNCFNIMSCFSNLGEYFVTYVQPWVASSVLRVFVRAYLEISQRLFLSGNVVEEQVRILQKCEREEIAIRTKDANEQHYEVPTDFFKLHLGKRLKYSASEWTSSTQDLEEAETNTLSRYQKENKIYDLKPGAIVLEMGCGWGSLSLKNARDYPNIQFMSFSNSRTQIQYIQEQCKIENITNLKVVVEDYNTFCTEDSVFQGKQFNRIFAIETLEHGRNIKKLFEWMSLRLCPDGQCFVQSLVHHHKAYLLDDSSWMGRNFFTGGQMFAMQTYLHLNEHLRVKKLVPLSGKGYGECGKRWLERLEQNKIKIKDKFGSETYEKFRMFYIQMIEAFSCLDGYGYMIGYYILTK